MFADFGMHVSIITGSVALKDVTMLVCMSLIAF